jgi:hypothetical protein
MRDLTTSVRRAIVKKTVFIAAALTTVLASAGAASAHHSFAMFDNTKNVSFAGTVKEVEWANPHVWLELTVTENGQDKPYKFEAGAIAVLKRVGWFRDTVKPGDKVVIVSHPFRDGRPGGSLERVMLPNGKAYGAGDAIPGALQVPVGR